MSKSDKGRTKHRTERVKIRKAPEVWKTRNFEDILRLCNDVYKQNAIKKRTKDKRKVISETLKATEHHSYCYKC